MDSKEKADILAKLDELKEDVANDKVDALVWGASVEDGVNVALSGNAIMTYGLAAIINQNISERIQRMHNQDIFDGVLSGLMENSDED